MSVEISTHELPIIDRVGHFPLLNAVFDFTYRNPSHAIHLYDYQAQVRIGSNEISISPGDITCIQSGMVYSIATDVPGKHWCIHYYDTPAKGDEFIPLPDHLRLGINSVFYREQIQLISRLNVDTGLGQRADLVKLEARFRLKALLLALHNLGAHQASRRRSRSDHSWDDLLVWVDENLNHPISVSLMSQRAKLSPSALGRKFKEAYKTTFSRYLLHRRIDKARSLLATTTLSIQEVGVAVGIPDPQYFNKQFRKVAGISPSRYRNDNREYLSNIPDELALKDGHWRDR